MQKLYKLDYEFFNRNGICLAVHSGGGFREEELSRIPLKIVMTSKIPHLLPMTLEHTDHRIRLIYEIGGLRMLSQVLNIERFSLNRSLQLLLIVVDVLESCRSNMLKENAFVLSDSFIFVGTELTEIYFMYLPLLNVEAPPVSEQLKLFIQKLAERLPEEEQEALREWAAVCESGTFEVAELRRRLQEQWAASPCNRLQGAPITQPGANPSCSQQFSVIMPVSLRKIVSIVVSAAGIACCTLLWKHYANSFAAEWLQLSLGTTLLFVAALIVIRYAVSNEQLTAVGAALMRYWNRDEVREEAAVSLYEKAPESSEILSDAAIAPGDYYAAIGLNTALLRPPTDATTLLSSNLAAAKHESEVRVTKAYLEIQEPGDMARIAINRESFKIGRIADISDYHIERAGVSRQHAEIIAQDGAYSLKDLGSTNGTYLNGERIAPYRTYPLSSGDYIAVAQVEFRFLIV